MFFFVYHVRPEQGFATGADEGFSRTRLRADPVEVQAFDRSGAILLILKNKLSARNAM